MSKSDKMAESSPELQEEIRKTQDALNFIRRPALSTKLLSQPPFKFIHDIVTELMKTLDDLPKRLFTGKELDRNGFSTKEEKMAYLEKLVQWTSLLAGRKVDVNTRSILSGKEPEKTNVLLQVLGKAIKISEGEPVRWSGCAYWTLIRRWKY